MLSVSLWSACRTLRRAKHANIRLSIHVRLALTSIHGSDVMPDWCKTHQSLGLVYDLLAKAKV